MKTFRPWARTIRNLAFCAIGTLTLAGACVIEADPECGDDVANGEDECDGDDFDGASCSNVGGFDEGDLGCTKSCKIDTSNCIILDEDLDQLNIHDEEQLGTDPLNPDTDGDGVLDGIEAQNGADATNAASWPGTVGGWPNHFQKSIDEGVVQTGMGVGDIIRNRAWTDQFGQVVNTHQFYGYVMVLTLAARWCGPCQQASLTAQALLEEHKLNGVVFVEQLIDGQTPGVDATPEDAQIWASTYGLHYPVVYAANAFTAPSIPRYYIVDRNLRINEIIDGYPGDLELARAINDALVATP